MRPICMGPELALPATYATTLSREAACRREETNDNTAPCDPVDGASSGRAKAIAPVASGTTPEEVG
jgi:hypothetical protein